MKLDTGNAKQRDLILFGEPYDEAKYLGGIRCFEEVTAEDIEELLHLNVIDPEETQDNSPSTTEILEFLQRHPNFTAHGYAVSRDRGDYSVTLEGVACAGPYDMEDVWDFCSWFKFADEFEIAEYGMYCWYD